MEVRSATSIQLVSTSVAQRQRRREFVFAARSIGPHQLAVPSDTFLLHHLETRLKMLWSVPWDNQFKDTLWRLTTQGVSGAGGHDISFPGPCPCGWCLPPPSSPSPPDERLARATDLRSHVFWHCPVSRAVVAELVLALPPGTAPLTPLEVWLLRPPSCPVTINSDMWAFVCMAAIHAMELGRRHLWSLVKSSSPPRDLVIQASRRASTQLWVLLQDFATLQSPPPSWESAGAHHPFFCFQPRTPSLPSPTQRSPIFRLNLPVVACLPASLA